MKKFILLLLLFAAPSVNAAVNDGNALLKNCKAAIKILDGEAIPATYPIGLCMGEVRGVVDAGALINLRAEKGGYDKHKFYCVPKAVTTSQVIRVVVNYLEANPDDLHQKDTALIALALNYVFPCE